MLDCLTTSPGFLPTLCENWSGFFYVHWVWLSYTRDWRLKISSERLSNEDKAPCQRGLHNCRGRIWTHAEPPVWKFAVYTLALRPRGHDSSSTAISQTNWRTCVGQMEICDFPCNAPTYIKHDACWRICLEKVMKFQWTDLWTHWTLHPITFYLNLNNIHSFWLKFNATICWCWLWITTWTR